jgi:hypothetical protein
MKTVRLLPILLLAGVCLGAQAQTIKVGDIITIDGNTITYTPPKASPHYIIKTPSGEETEVPKEIVDALDRSKVKSIDVMNDRNAVIITLKEATSTAVETVVEGWGILSPEKAKPTPLIILRQSDGEEKEITQAEMEAIDPNNIKSLDIKNDRTTIENYGPKASDGVIIIRMKE